MKEFLIYIIIPLLFPMIYSYDPSKMLIIYFTKTNNTQLFANYIKEIMGITNIYKIVPVIPYPDEYNELSNKANEEKENNERPEIFMPLNNISKYDIILLGYPLWHQNIPNIVITQIEKLDWKGKILYPFNTHGSSGLGDSVNDIKQYAIGADVKDGFPISQSKIKLEDDSKLDIKDWVKKNFDNNNDNEKQEVNETKKNASKNKKRNYFIYAILIILL